MRDLKPEQLFTEIKKVLADKEIQQKIFLSTICGQSDKRQSIYNMPYSYKACVITMTRESHKDKP